MVDFWGPTKRKKKAEDLKRVKYEENKPKPKKIKKKVKTTSAQDILDDKINENASAQELIDENNK